MTYTNLTACQAASGVDAATALDTTLAHHKLPDFSSVILLVCGCKLTIRAYDYGTEETGLELTGLAWVFRTQTGRNYWPGGWATDQVIDIEKLAKMADQYTKSHRSYGTCNY